MGALLIIAGIIFVIYQAIKCASEPVNKGSVDWEKSNRDAMSGQYSSRQLEKRYRQGFYIK
jgi:hypothetical protein